MNAHAIKKRLADESGSALIAVLCVTLAGAMLAAAVAAYSKYSTFDVTAHIRLQRSYYVNEGVANRIQWMIAAERATNGTGAMLGEVDYSEYDYDRILPDGVVHTVDYHGTPVRVVVTDAISGLDFYGNSYVSTFSRLKNWKRFDSSWGTAIDSLSYLFKDYIDLDDLVTSLLASEAEGMEADEYEDAGMEPLPANSSIQYREEFFWLKGFQDIFQPDANGRLRGVRLIPPENTGRLNGTPSLMNADLLTLMIYNPTLENDNVVKAMRALDKWRNERAILSEQLDGDVLGILRTNLSSYQSNYFTVEIDAPDDSRRPSHKLVFTFKAFSISGPENEQLKYMEWINY